MHNDDIASVISVCGLGNPYLGPWNLDLGTTSSRYSRYWANSGVIWNVVSRRPTAGVMGSKMDLSG